MSVLSFYTRRLSILKAEERSRIYLQKGHHIPHYTRGLLATLSILGKRSPLYDKEEDPGPYSLPTQKAFLFFVQRRMFLYSLYIQKRGIDLRMQKGSSLPSPSIDRGLLSYP